MAKHTRWSLPSARSQKIGTTITLQKSPDGAVIKRTVLPGGLRVISEHVPAMRSVSVGMWVNVGSRDEETSVAGSAHFLEHLLFKGTTSKTALEISSAIDRVGGEMNAFTGKEYTCFYSRVLDQDLDVAIETLSDMLVHSTIDKKDFEAERQVILEEIAMRDDDFADIAHEGLVQALFGKQNLGRPILGTRSTITKSKRDVVWNFYKHHYKPSQIVVAAAGGVDHMELVKLVKKGFSPLLKGSSLPAKARSAKFQGKVQHQFNIAKRTSEQAHLVLGYPALARGDNRRYQLGMLNTILGGGMSSRLFQEIREVRGLAYTTYAFAQSFSDTGYLGIYAGFQPQKAHEVLNVIDEVTTALAVAGPSDEELIRAKGQMKGSLVLGQEDSSSRMNRIAKAELATGELPSVDELLRRIDSVSVPQVQAIARDIFGSKQAISLVGPYSSVREFTGSKGGLR
jgi:predicted Zn-dependent peptidase